MLAEGENKALLFCRNETRTMPRLDYGNGGDDGGGDRDSRGGIESSSLSALPKRMFQDKSPITTNTTTYSDVSKNSIAKYNWWHSAAQPLKLNKTIETAIVNKLPQTATSMNQLPSPRHHLENPTDKDIGTTNDNIEANTTQATDNNTPNSHCHHHHHNQHQHHHTTPNSPLMKIRKSLKPVPTPKTTTSTEAGFEPYRSNEAEENTQDSCLITPENKPCHGLLNPNEDDEMKVTGYSRSLARTLLCWLCICLTGGLLRLILHWWRHWYLLATHTPCPLDEAEKVLVEEEYQGKHKIFYVKQIQNLTWSAIKQNANDLLRKEKYADAMQATSTTAAITDGWDEKNLYLSLHFSSAQIKHNQNVRLFSCKQLRYAWDSQAQAFVKLRGLDVNIPCVYYHQQKGLTTRERLSRYTVYGPNEITVPYKDIPTLLFLEVLNPFYVFQLFSVVLWFTYDYYYYACVILLMSIFGVAMSIVQTKKNQDALCETVKNTGTALLVTDKGHVCEMPTECLVPGDVIEIPTIGCTMQCDAVLLSGNCILDESMLTGESVPVTKTPLPAKRDVVFDKKEHARHTLFCGTKVIQTRYIGSEKVLALVINTGNITAKGGLIRSILYPPPVDYKFEKDSYKFIECLGLIALIGFVYTLITKIMRDVDPVKIAVESLDLITIVVPPALPAAMTVGRFYAQKRLERNNIFCISPRSINVAGSIDCCCFDKTGTLTEDGLDMWGVVPKSITNQFQIPIREINRLPFDNFLFGMVTCHSITILNGKMMGDPLDLKMFESTGWQLEDPKDIADSQKYGLIFPTIVRPKINLNAQQSDTMERKSSVDNLLADIDHSDGVCSNDHGVVREFPFTSSLQRMSVITRRLCEKNFNVYCKGSPEMLQQLCRPDTLPENYSQQLAVFAKQGYRIIAMAYKSLNRKINYTKVQRLTRESAESDLEFLGFVVLENRLKPDTTDVIKSLTSANIRTIMVTGDNILTALSVARDCGIISTSQAVVTVNVRENEAMATANTTTDDDGSVNNLKSNHYELYYTLELGSKECVQTLSSSTMGLNGNGSINNTKQRNCSADYCNEYYRLNGDINSLNSCYTMSMPNSDSLASIETCDTLTHNDVELGLPIDSITDLKKCDDWRRNYRFAMVGKTWQIVREHFPLELQNFLTRGTIYARMSPEQKQALIMELQNIDYCVAMCGDGANDCGALKVAHTGISLSETESSIASPFTSRNPTIASVPNVIKEGRAALVTSFGIFKYMAAYSMVQFISVMILYSIDSNLTDKQYLYIDLGLISVFAFFFGKTESYAGPLVKQVPLSSLISLTPLSSIVLHLLIVIVFQGAGWYQLHQQPWFVPFKLSDEDHLGCFENYTMFAISSFQYIILAFVFSKGSPYRRSIISNLPFCLTLIINLCIVIYLILYPAEWLANFFQLIMPPTMGFRYWMLIYGICNFIAHIIIENFVVEYFIFKKIQAQREQNVSTSKRKHMKIESDLQYLPNWPQITDACEVYMSSSPKEDKHPNYVEISAEQSVDTPTSNNNALDSFFDIDSGATTPLTPKSPGNGIGAVANDENIKS